jgi:hypothetical protein
MTSVLAASAVESILREAESAEAWEWTRQLTSETEWADEYVEPNEPLGDEVRVEPVTSDLPPGCL